MELKWLLFYEVFIIKGGLIAFLIWDYVKTCRAIERRKAEKAALKAKEAETAPMPEPVPAFQEAA